MKKKIVAFDLDGTLIDSAPDISFALNKVLLKNNLKEVSLNSVRNLIGKGAKALIKDAFDKQHTEVENLENLTNEFLHEYNLCFKNSTYLFDNVKYALKELKKNNFILILVSNKPQFYVKNLLYHFRINNFFSFYSGGDTFSFRKPDPRHIYESLANAGVLSNYKGIFIGDSKYDYECAENANWPCVLFSKGYSDIDIRILKPKKIFHNYTELPKIIKSIFDD